MKFTLPKDSEKYHWTHHAQYKMQHYGLSAQRLKRVMRNPKRIEKSIVKNMVAVMQPTSLRKKDGKETWTQEVWVMYKLGKVKTQMSNSKKEFSAKISILQKRMGEQKQLHIISAWRYPGVSPKRDPIPDEILEELRAVL